MQQLNRDLNRVVLQIPNLLSLLRVVLACVFFALMIELFRYNSGFIVTLAVFCAICLTDFLDGQLARKLGATSEAGAWLDLGADLFYIVISLVVLNALGQVPAWFTIIVIGKFIEYLITSFVLRPYRENGAVFVRDFFGRCVAYLYFFIPGIICVLYVVPGWDYKVIVHVLLVIITSFTVLSFIVRCSTCIHVAGVPRKINNSLLQETSSEVKSETVW
jgi:CDP-diacylglycerol---glycerol-3-phosphate 3-phosphatidyltransferase